jgi:hypothetical protein
MRHPIVARLVRLSAALAVLIILAAAFVAPAAADTISSPRAFATLRGTVVSRVPANYQRTMLPLVDLAQYLAVGSDRLPPNPCASAGTLLVLDGYVIVVAGSRGFDQASARAVRTDIRSALASLFPADPIFPTDPLRRCLPPNPIVPPNPI